jgi:hypothetical protein
MKRGSPRAGPFPKGSTLESVRRAVAAGCLAAALIASVAGTAAADDVHTANAVVTPGLVAHRATLTLKLHFEMTCGKPGPGPVTIDLPAKMQAMPSLAVRVGTAPTTSAVKGHRVTVQLPQPHGISCMVIAPGTLTLNLAGVRNPRSAGTYFVHAHLRAMAFTAQLAVRS